MVWGKAHTKERPKIRLFPILFYWKHEWRDRTWKKKKKILTYRIWRCGCNLSRCLTMNMQVMVPSHGLLLYLIRIIPLNYPNVLLKERERERGRVSLSLRINCCINTTQIINSEGFFPWAPTGSRLPPNKSKALETKLLFTPFTCFRKYPKQFNAA